MNGRHLLLLALLAPAWAGAAPAFNAGDMAVVPAGRYEPLFSNEQTQRVAAFRLDVYPVTNAQFLEFVRACPKWRRSAVRRVFADVGYLQHWADDLELGPRPAAGREVPVTQVSWFAANAYARWVGKRLPTLAEWEYAAAASETAADARADTNFMARILAWYSRPGGSDGKAVGSTFRNLYGIWDLHGLVWEWVSDFNTALVTGESRGDAALDRNLFCGAGAVGMGDVRDYTAFMRYAMRSSLKAAFTTANLGFRCAAEPEPPP